MSNPRLTGGSTGGRLKAGRGRRLLASQIAAVSLDTHRTQRREALFVLAFAIAIGLASWWFLPRGDEIDAVGTIKSIQISTNLDGGLDLTFRPGPRDSTVVTVFNEESSYPYGSSPNPIRPSVSVDVTAPRNTWNPKRCLNGGLCDARNQGELEDVIFSIAVKPPSFGQAVAQTTFTIPADLPHSGYPMKENAVHVSVQVPPVQVTYLGPGVPDMGLLSVTYYVPDAANYAWTEQQSPETTAGSATWIASEATGLQAIQAGGSNANEVNLESQRTFFAGAVIGLAGALAAGALQSLYSLQEWRWQHRRRRAK
jgi:hypothetical protein